jgi:hypothetical protein
MHLLTLQTVGKFQPQTSSSVNNQTFILSRDFTMLATSQLHFAPLYYFFTILKIKTCVLRVFVNFRHLQPQFSPLFFSTKFRIFQPNANFYPRFFPRSRKFRQFTAGKIKTRKYPLTLESESATWTVLMANWRKLHWIFFNFVIFNSFSIFPLQLAVFYSTRCTSAQSHSQTMFAVNFTLPSTRFLSPLFISSFSRDGRSTDLREKRAEEFFLVTSKILVDHKATILCVLESESHQKPFINLKNPQQTSKFKLESPRKFHLFSII